MPTATDYMGYNFKLNDKNNIFKNATDSIYSQFSLMLTMK